MFRRSKAEAPTPESPLLDSGKGRPTPTRKEAEAAAKARAQAARDPRAARARARTQRQDRVESSRAIREGIKAGDERYLGKRDRGPMRRFVRDFVDSRLNVAEFTIPLMFASLLLSGANQNLGGGILNATVLVVTLDSIWLVFRLKRELRKRFPQESRKGTTFYALTRALQLRFMRIPKSQVKLGQKLPDTYR
ncbi:MAG TPA: DUF3043 domain-containing protein [Nocardioidaceae bacterium]|nr:DUF3043 domain-containing protein [Nocardioidaceae bacterium]